MQKFKENDLVIAIINGKKNGGKIAEISGSDVTVKLATGGRFSLPITDIREAKILGQNVVSRDGRPDFGTLVAEKGYYFGYSPNNPSGSYVFQKESGGFRFCKTGDSNKQRSQSQRIRRRGGYKTHKERETGFGFASFLFKII